MLPRCYEINMAVNNRIMCLGVVILFILCNIINVHSKKTLITLNEDDWGSMLHGEWMVEFYAPWCPACKALQPVWEELSQWSEDLGINVAKIDVTTSPGLSGRFMVTALPTIFHVLNGEFRQYRGGRDKDSLISFVDDKKWKDIEVVPSWKSPGSIQMSALAYFFKISTYLRAAHSHMVDVYGLPTWCSYLIFATTTIIVGALLGLLLVCVIDYIYPPTAPRPTLDVTLDGDQEDEGDDLIDDTANSDNEDGGSLSRSQTQTEDETQSETEDDGQAVERIVGKGKVRRRRAD